MNNDYTKYDMNGYHDSHCEGPNCNCDSRRYGYGTERPFQVLCKR